MKTFQIVLAMLAGALFLLAFQVAWMIDSGCIVRKSDADAKRHWDRVYSQIAVNGVEE